MINQPPKPGHQTGAPASEFRGKGSVIPSRAEMNQLHASRNNMKVDGGKVIVNPTGTILYPSRPVVIVRTSASDGAGANGPFVVSVYANGMYTDSGDAVAATATAVSAYGPGMPVGVPIVGWRVNSHYEFSTAGIGGTVVKITSGGPGDTYVGSVFANGPDEAATQTGVAIVIMGMAVGETAVTGRSLLAALIDGTYYAQVPLWQ